MVKVQLAYWDVGQFLCTYIHSNQFDQLIKFFCRLEYTDLFLVGWDESDSFYDTNGGRQPSLVKVEWIK